MKNPDNIAALCTLPIDMMGLIFYPLSPRNACGISSDSLSSIPERVQKVGVFVNEEKEIILSKIQELGLQMAQLHGNESPETCLSLKEKGYPVIKAFSIESANDFIPTNKYEGTCDYFLFDTKSPVYGGSGKHFDWNMLNHYKGKTPFFLSGGINIEDVERIKNIQHEQLFALDLNSRFESAPGLKNIELIHTFINNI